MPLRSRFSFLPCAQQLFFYQVRQYRLRPEYDLLDSIWQEYVAPDSPLSVEVCVCACVV